jgi:EcsC protein family
VRRADRDWVRRLTADEQAALKESEDFFQRPSGRLQKTLEKIGRPLDFLFKATPKKLQSGVTNAIHGVLTTVAEGAEAGSSEASLIDELCAKGGMDLTPWERIFTLDVHMLDQTAQQKLSAAKKMATVQGGLTGITGAPGLVADIPSLYFLLFRTVHQIAICLGHPAHSPSERRYLLQVVNVGHHLELRERRCALMELDELEREISTKAGTTEDLQRAMLAKTVQLLARKLTSTLIQRKAAQTVAFVGGAVGAVINRQLVEDVGLTARHAYRRRFLKQAALKRT